MIKRIAIATNFLLLACGAGAANWYVRPGGSNAKTGADWNNAWDIGGIKWTSLSAGDTVWLAGGSYPSSVYPARTSSVGGFVFVRRVQAGDAVPTSAAGWNSSFDSQVILNPSAGSDGIGFYTTHGGDNTYWDGRVPSGILISMPYASGGSQSHLAAIDIGQNFGAGPFPPNGNIVFTNIECVGPYYTAVNNGNGYNYYATGIYLQSCTNITVASVNIHGFLDGLLGWNSQYVTFDHCSVYDIKEVYANGAPSIGHANIIEPAYPSFGYFTWKYCRFWNWDNEGIQPCFNPNGPLTIYGCTFENSGGWGRVIEPRYSGTSYAGGGTLPQGPLYFYNNTCVNCNGGKALGASNPGVWSGGDNPNGVNGWNAGSIIRNNIYWNCTSMPTPSLADFDYSDSLLGQTHGVSGVNAQPFVKWNMGILDYAGTNFHIVSNVGPNYPRNKGTTIANSGGNTFNLDMDGNARGADGSWDIGAYEYSVGANVTNPIIAVSPPSLSFGSVLFGRSVTNAFTVQNVGGGTLAGTATVPPPFFIVSGGTYSLGSNQGQTISISFSPSTNANANSQNVIFTGGGGATARVSGQLIALVPVTSVRSFAGIIPAPSVAIGGSFLQDVGVFVEGQPGAAPDGKDVSWLIFANAVAPRPRVTTSAGDQFDTQVLSVIADRQQLLSASGGNAGSGQINPPKNFRIALDH